MTSDSSSVLQSDPFNVDSLLFNSAELNPLTGLPASSIQGTLTAGIDVSSIDNIDPLTGFPILPSDSSLSELAMPVIFLDDPIFSPILSRATYIAGRLPRESIDTIGQQFESTRTHSETYSYH